MRTEKLMHHANSAKRVPDPGDIVTRIDEVPGGSIEYTLDERAARTIDDRSKLREIAEEAVRRFLGERTRGGAH